jgi:nucleoside-diphosphate-sugar epimerase
VTFRPGIVLGPGGNPRHLGVANWPYKSVCQLWGDGNNKLPIVLVEDVAEALVKAIDVPGIEGESYNLTSQPCITANDYLNELEAVSGLRISRVEGSPLKDYLQGLVKWGIKSIGRDPHVSFPSYADSEGRSFSAVFSFAKAQQELGWNPIQDREVLIHRGIHQPVAEFIGTNQV